MGIVMRLLPLLLLLALIEITDGISHTTTLVWTERFVLDGSVKIKGIVGDPDIWTTDDIGTGQANPADDEAASPHMLALGFRYKSQELFFSDIGYKTLYKFHLEKVDEVQENYHYNTSSQIIYKGTSSEVNGIAVDWLAGTIYWTDARYNWIAMAATKRYEIYKYLLTTGVDKPMGIAVHPHKGLLFWSDWGVVPKIEVANLDGTNRRTLLQRDIDYPMGITIDYAADHLYWVDDARDSIERSNLDGTNRHSIDIKMSDTSRHYLFGIAVYKDYLFITDQKRWTIMAFSKTTRRKVQEVQVGILSMPYDVMMYDETIQDNGESECDWLDCEHLCLSLGGGKGKCDCSQGYVLQPDGRTCNESGSFTQPQYIYSIGHSICASKIHFPDRFYSASGKDVNCFLQDQGQVEAIGFESYAELLFYSDTKARTISRKRLIGDYDEEIIARNTGNVRGIAVDWLSDNVYWTDEDKGHVMVTDLEGRYPTILISGLSQPRGLAVDPVKGVLYISCIGAIYKAKMDGSNINVFIGVNVTRPDGLVLDLVKERLYWTDSEVPGIGFINPDGSGRAHLHIDSSPNMTFRDVTVYQEYIAATNGENAILYAYVEDGYMVRGSKHEEAYVSHDIITYGSYLQPIPKVNDSDPTPPSRCDRKCDHLCLAMPGGYQCQCGLGFNSKTVNRTDVCVTDVLDEEFLLVVDPNHKQAFQMSTQYRKPALSAVGLTTAEQPRILEYDYITRYMYWYDAKGKVIKMKDLHGIAEEVVVILDKNTEVGALAVDDINKILFYTDGHRGRIVHVTLPVVGEAEEFDFISSHVLPAAMTIDKKRGVLFWAEEKDGETTIYSQLTTATHPSVQLHNYGQHFNHELISLTLDVAENWLYLCTNRGEVSGVDLNGVVPNRIVQLDPNPNTKIAVHRNYLYYTRGSRTVMGKNIMSGESAIQITPDDVFTQLTDLKVFTQHTPRPQTTMPTTATTTTSKAPSTTPKGVEPSETGLDIFVLIGAVGGAIVLLAVVIAAALIMLRRKKNKRKPAVPPTDFDTHAHDNPTYVTAEEVQAMRRQITLPPLGGATGVSHDPLPDKPDLLPEELPGEEYVSMDIPVAPAAAVGDRTGEIAEADTEKLVDNEHVIVSVDSISTQAVSYSPNNTQEKKK